MIFLGILFPKEEELIIKEKSKGHGIQNQVNTYQWSCIDGLYENIGSKLRIINVLPVGTFPLYYKDLFIPSKEWSYHNEFHWQVGSINIPFFKQFFRYIKIKKILKKTDDKEIIIYSTYLPFLKAIFKLDKRYHINLIVTDLPEYYDLTEKVCKVRKILREFNNRLIAKYMKRIDRFVLVSDYMKYPLNVGRRPYVVVEGICQMKGQEKINKNDRKSKIVLYTGTVNRKFGIDILLDAFSCIKEKDYELWICGTGDYESEILKKANGDTRIKYFGYVSKAEVEKKQQQAAILINPRQNIGEYTKYSFPSKTMEYLVTGKPVIAYKLDGIPEDYDRYINFVEDNTVEALSKKIVEIMNHYMIYKEKALSGREYVMKNKNQKVQAKKILDLVSAEV